MYKIQTRKIFFKETKGLFSFVHKKIQKKDKNVLYTILEKFILYVMRNILFQRLCNLIVFSRQFIKSLIFWRENMAGF